MEKNDPLYVMDKPGTDTFKTQETLALIGNHYESHRFFMPKNIIYKDLYKIKDIPIIIVQGRHDVVTPFRIAYTVAKMMPLCELRVIMAGHTMHEHSIMKALRLASIDMTKRIE